MAALPSRRPLSVGPAHPAPREGLARAVLVSAIGVAPRLSVAHPPRLRPDASISAARTAHQGFLTMERSSGGQTVPEPNRVVNRTTGRDGPHRVVASAAARSGCTAFPTPSRLRTVTCRAFHLAGRTGQLCCSPMKNSAIHLIHMPTNITSTKTSDGLRCSIALTS